MFLFVTRYLGFLKYIPGLSIVFDSWLKLWTLLTKPQLLDWIDDIETEVLTWPGASTTIHKYGGLQFNFGNKELGHIHSNGLLDILLSRKIKQQLMPDGRILDHHVFKGTGWISFYVCDEADKEYAVGLLRMGYELRGNKRIVAVNNGSCS